MGPQVGYYVPQILMEEDLHGPGIDARGAAFAGVNLASSSATARDYAWSATTATSDNVDTFAEVLCKDSVPLPLPRQVQADGKAGQDREMGAERDRLDRSRRTDPDRLPDGARDRLRPRQGRRQEGRLRPPSQHLLPRGRLGARLLAAERTRLRHRRHRLQEGGLEIDFLFNWSYVDAEHIAYALSGACRSGPRKPRPTSRSSAPASTTGRASSRPPARPTYLPFSKHPQAVDPDYLVSWNNKQAPEWAAADDQYAYGPFFRSQLIANRVKAGIKGNEKMTIAQLVQAMEEPATRTCAATCCCRAPKAIGTPKSAALKEALATLKHLEQGRRPPPRPRPRRRRRGNAGDRADGRLVAEAGRPPSSSRRSARRPSNASRGCSRSATRSKGRRTRPPSPKAGGATSTRTCATSTGPKPKGAYSRVYCGGGSKSKCRSLLQRTLGEALKVTPARALRRRQRQVRGRPAAGLLRPEPAQVTAGITLPPFPFQNRPVFQQVGDADPEAAALSAGGGCWDPSLRTTAGRFCGRGPERPLERRLGPATVPSFCSGGMRWRGFVRIRLMAEDGR